MTDTTKTPDKLWVMRNKVGIATPMYRFALARNADRFYLGDGIVQGLVWYWDTDYGVMEQMHPAYWELIRPDLKLKPGEGPIEVKPWPEVPSEEAVARADSVLRDGYITEAIRLPLVEAIRDCIEFARFFQEPTK